MPNNVGNVSLCCVQTEEYESDMPEKLQCTYSTISADALMAHIIPQYSIDNVLECRFWQRGANDTYQINCADTRYFLRIFRCGAFPREAIEFEAAVLDYIRKQGLPVAYPIALKNGGFLTEIAAPEGIRYILVFALADGTEPDYDCSEHCRLVGASVAEMHLATRNFQTTFTRPRLDLLGLLEQPMAVISRFMAHRPDQLDFMEAVARDAKQAVLAAPEALLDSGIVHGDMHGGNVHIHNSKVTHFDFEECAFGYRVYDLGTLKWGCGLPVDEQRAKRWPAILEGYVSVKSLSDVERSLVNTFVLVREISEIAYGIRHVRDFGYADIMASDIDDMCKRIDWIRDILNS